MSDCSYNSESNAIDLAWWSCISTEEIEELSSGEDYPTLRSFWLKTVVKNPIDYVFNKIATTSLFIFPSPASPAPNGVPDNDRFKGRGKQ
jgi:hypothetical protein